MMIRYLMMSVFLHSTHQIRFFYPPTHKKRTDQGQGIKGWLPHPTHPQIKNLGRPWDWVLHFINVNVGNVSGSSQWVEYSIIRVANLAYQLKVFVMEQIYSIDVYTVNYLPSIFNDLFRLLLNYFLLLGCINTPLVNYQWPNRKVAQGWCDGERCYCKERKRNTAVNLANQYREGLRQICYHALIPCWVG